MSYATDDFRESLIRVAIEPAAVARVIAAWGHGTGMGVDAGHYRWSDDGASDWCGGFLMQLRDGRYCYVTGWCDYTGWGCQDGAETHYFEALPELSALTAASEYHNEPDAGEWDIEPADLNHWLAMEAAKSDDAVDPDVGGTTE